MFREEIIAKRYAQGLAEYARDAACLEETREDLGVLLELVGQDGDGEGESEGAAFRRFLASPSVPLRSKLDTAARVVEKAGLNRAVGGFLEVLIRHGRVGLLGRAVRRFADLAGEMTGELAAVVHTARPLSGEQGGRLAEALSRAFGGKVHIRQVVDPTLLAGAKVLVGGKVIDGSVLGRLERLRRRLTSGGWERQETAED